MAEPTAQELRAQAIQQLAEWQDRYTHELFRALVGFPIPLKLPAVFPALKPIPAAIQQAYPRSK